MSAADAVGAAKNDDAAETGYDLYWVATYLTFLDYGGPEEGRWYYESGILITDSDTYERLGAGPAGFPKRLDAKAHAARMRGGLADLNKGRPPIHASNAIGLYEIRIMRAPVLPQRLPRARPRYE